MPNEEQRIVSSLQDHHIWRLEDLQFPPLKQLEQLIQGIPVIQLTILSDSFVWPQNNGVCSVSSTSKFLYQQANIPFAKSLWSWIWEIHCPKKIKIFIWKSMRNRLPTHQYLAFSRPKLNNYCPRCNTPKTTILILRDCLWAKMVWFQSPGILPLLLFQLPLQTWLQTNTTSATLILYHQLPWKIYFPFLCWRLWLARNERIFNSQSHS